MIGVLPAAASAPLAKAPPLPIDALMMHAEAAVSARLADASAAHFQPVRVRIQHPGQAARRKHGSVQQTLLARGMARATVGVCLAACLLPPGWLGLSRARGRDGHHDSVWALRQAR